jgi:hypothetical protein
LCLSLDFFCSPLYIFIPKLLVIMFSGLVYIDSNLGSG